MKLTKYYLLFFSISSLLFGLETLPVKEVIIEAFPETFEAFQLEYLSGENITEQPILFKGIANCWGSAAWDFDYFIMHHGGFTLPTVVVYEKDKVTLSDYDYCPLPDSFREGFENGDLPLYKKESEDDDFFAFKKFDKSLSQYIANLRMNPHDISYLAALNIDLLDLPLDQLKLPKIIDSKFETEQLIFLGPKNTKTFVHNDIGAGVNLFLQVVGRKQFILAAPSEEHNFPKEINQMGTEDLVYLDITKPAVLERHPSLKNVTFYKVIVEPGDILLLPADWFHDVRSLESSISIATFYTNGHLRKPKSNISEF